MDGYQALTGIRNLEKQRNVPEEKAVKATQVDSSCPIVLAPAFLIASKPFAPSPPIPVKIIPTA